MSEKISLGTAIKRGLKCRCPKCGEGKIFRTFLKVSDTCPACGEEFFHHRADDMPAYVVIVLAGHLVVPVMLIVMSYYSWPDWVHMLIWMPAFFVISLALLQPVKGAIVALQWHLGLHGFAEAKNRRLKA